MQCTTPVLEGRSPAEFNDQRCLIQLTRQLSGLEGVFKQINHQTVPGSGSPGLQLCTSACGFNLQVSCYPRSLKTHLCPVFIFLSLHCYVSTAGTFFSFQELFPEPRNFSSVIRAGCSSWAAMFI